ncbi:30S ribosomal protein S2 [Candidatus Woesearchaeota archaeon]|nr:MAG: small subunit ribosomal protein S2 [archaeon GW2011_AR18]MBS3162021.1 30S ribosomal protein S2 [Candidatus Woesearchaeota archaeon]
MTTEEQHSLVPQDEYLKVGLHIGTKFRTKAMMPFIYKVRPDGLSVLNVQKINERLELAGKLLSNYKPEDVLVVCRRENGWSAVEMFSKVTGIRSFTGRYHPGVLTNTKLEDFIEVKLIFVTDPFPDKNLVEDAAKIGIPVIALCDTNNELNNIDLVIPCNNKGKKSLGLIFYILAREYQRNRGIINSNDEFTPKIDEFSPE